VACCRWDSAVDRWPVRSAAATTCEACESTHHCAALLLQVLRQQLYPEEPQLLSIPQAPVRGPTNVPEASFRSPEDFLVVDSADAAERVAAALVTLPGHPSAAEAAAAAGPEAAAKPRPSIMDYHTSYSAGGCAVTLCQQIRQAGMQAIQLLQQQPGCVDPPPCPLHASRARTCKQPQQLCSSFASNKPMPLC
jgi:hypothetical protein